MQMHEGIYKLYHIFQFLNVHIVQYSKLKKKKIQIHTEAKCGYGKTSSFAPKALTTQLQQELHRSLLKYVTAAIM